jgi:hypothetical protein
MATAPSPTGADGSGSDWGDLNSGDQSDSKSVSYGSGSNPTGYLAASCDTAVLPHWQLGSQLQCCCVHSGTSMLWEWRNALCTSLQCLPHHHDQLIQFNVQAAGRAGEGHNGQLPSYYRDIVPPVSLRNWWAIGDPSCITIVRHFWVNGKIFKIRQWSSTAPALWQGLPGS